MKNYNRIATIIRLIARIWDSLILLFLLIFAGMHAMGTLFGQGGGFNSLEEKLIFFLSFPVGTMIGLAIAWKWEGLGGLIIASGIIFQFIMNPDLSTNLFFVGMGLIGLLFLVYWALTRHQQEDANEPGSGQRKIRRNNLVIALVISLVPVFIFIWSEHQNRDKSYITTEEDSSYNKKVEYLDIIATVEDPLIHVFAHSFEHSLASGLELNGIKAMVSINSQIDNPSDNAKELEDFDPEATLYVNIKPLHRTRDDGYEAIVGSDFEANLIDKVNENNVWHATGKVDYIVFFPSHYKAGEGIRKEIAWRTTAAIVNAFVAEVNGQKPAPIYTFTEERQYHGQRVD